MITEERNTEKPASIWSVQFLLCMLVAAAVAFGYGMFNPALPIYASTMGLMTDVVGTIVAIATTLCMFARLLVGGLSNYYDKKKLVMAALALSICGYAGYFIADNAFLLLLARCFQAVGQGMTTTLLSTIAIETLPPEKLGSGIGIFSLASSLAQCFAPMIGTAMAGAGNFRFLFIVSIIMNIVALVFVFQLKEKLTGANPVSWKNILNIKNYYCREAIPAAVMLLFNGLIYSSISNYISIYGLSKGLTRVGVFFTINSITMLLTRPLGGRLADEKPLWVIMLPGYFAQMMACLLIASADGMAAISLAGVLYGFGFGSTQAAVQIMAVRSVQPQKRGVANSTFYVGGDIGLSAGALSAGILAKNMGYENTYFFMAGMAFLCFIYFITYQLKLKRKAD